MVSPKGRHQMTDAENLDDHYASGTLLASIEAGLAKLGLADPLPLEALAPVDEFHVGGRAATESFVASMGLGKGDRALDLGCGLGGPARYVAATTGAKVLGIDLTAEYVETGRALNERTGLADAVSLRQGSILDLPDEAQGVDVAYMIHVGMNIADKRALAAGVARVLKPGGLFAIYDIMQVGEEDIDFPLPWASTADQSALASPAEYRAALEEAGFTIEAETDRTAFARDFFARLSANQAQADGPPPLGLHLVMGTDTATKIKNMVGNIAAGRIAPVEIMARLN